MGDLKPQWLKDLARDNLKREIEIQNRKYKKDAKPHDICLHLIHNEKYKHKQGLKLVQRSLVPLDYKYNAVKCI